MLQKKEKTPNQPGASEQIAWDMYYATVVGFTMHPGYEKPGTEKPSLEKLAEMADEMMIHRGQRWQS